MDVQDNIDGSYTNYGKWNKANEKKKREREKLHSIGFHLHKTRGCKLINSDRKAVTGCCLGWGDVGKSKKGILPRDRGKL